MKLLIILFTIKFTIYLVFITSHNISEYDFLYNYTINWDVKCLNIKLKNKKFNVKKIMNDN